MPVRTHHPKYSRGAACAWCVIKSNFRTSIFLHTNNMRFHYMYYVFVNLLSENALNCNLVTNPALNGMKSLLQHTTRRVEFLFLGESISLNKEPPMLLDRPWSAESELAGSLLLSYRQWSVPKYRYREPISIFMKSNSIWILMSVAIIFI